ncbi:hypothetical protein H6F78_23275 [Coleofasciculus sp. FACHB-64]|uniref:hypothetical protein n=1 Tax=Cyanophyceae TaxID=3028117 RepID=UPI0016887260|nr:MULTISPECIES: hypothetical protein [unclassified Coleofasciculus]MBD1838964.1 hypothetical protein [Coleofasciculus sp. FACHB-501]MBD2048480.1 hypothetical protein [Coleofasciculus sp. FACHB-64]
MKIEVGIFSLLGALVGAGAAIVASLINNKFQLRREKEKWQREQLQEIYSNCIYNLMRYIQGFEEGGQKGVDFAESSRWLSLLLIHHPSKDTDNETFKAFRYKVIELTRRGGSLMGWDKVQALRDEIIEMAEKDSRLN